MADSMTAGQLETQRLIEECEAAGGECIPCLELLKRIDDDLAQMDREEAARRRRRNLILTGVGAVVIVAVTASVYFLL